MPVVFRGRSEYDRNYEWNQSYRSASFVPKLEQSANDAGLRSDEMGFVVGPRMTSKKKAWHRGPQIQNCLNWWPENDIDSCRDDAVKMKENECSPVIKANKQARSKRQSPVKSSARQQVQSLSKTTNTCAKKPKSSHNANTVTTPARMRADSVKKQMKMPLPENDTTTNADKENTPAKENAHKQTSGNKKPRNSTTTSEKIQGSSTPGSKKLEGSIPLERKAGLNAKRAVRTSRARLSEYQRNFVPPRFSMKPSPMLSALDLVHTSSPAIPPHSGTQLHRTSEYISNYATEYRRDQDTNVKSINSPASPSMKMKVKHMQKPYLTGHGKIPFKSEYSAQYEANRKFDIVQLRQMAEKNKQKHEGTHIDPEHATQVISPFNKLWDMSSDEGSEIARDAKAVKKDECQQDDQVTESDQEKDAEDKWSKASQKGSDTVEELIEDKETVIDTDSLEERSTVSKDSVARKLAWDEEQPQDTQSDSNLQSDILKEQSSILEGRVSTPRLLKMGGALRTHHDLTTPSVGGAILVSPSHRKSVESDVSYSIEDPVKSQVAGSPTYDFHALLQGRPHPLVRSSPDLPKKRTPMKQQSSPAKERSRKKVPPKTTPPTTVGSNKRAVSRAPIRGALKNEEFQHCGTTGKLQTAPVYLQNDDDTLSVASSLTSARATELLQRAKDRKGFWATN